MSGTLAEIWSNALMLVGPGEIAELIAGDENIAGVYLDWSGRVEGLLV